MSTVVSRKRSASPLPRGGKKAFVELTFVDYNHGEYCCFVGEEDFAKATFDDAHGEHCDYVCEYVNVVGKYVLFSKKACDFVAKVLAMDGEKLGCMEEFTASLAYAYEEMFAVYYFVVNGYELYYEEDDKVTRLYVPDDARHFVVDALYELVEYLYAAEKIKLVA
jgi:hypothetical protein